MDGVFAEKATAASPHHSPPKPRRLNAGAILLGTKVPNSGSKGRMASSVRLGLTAAILIRPKAKLRPHLSDRPPLHGDVDA